VRKDSIFGNIIADEVLGQAEVTVSVAFKDPHYWITFERREGKGFSRNVDLRSRCRLAC
jgi:hypothetical protein